MNELKQPTNTMGEPKKRNVLVSLVYLGVLVSSFVGCVWLAVVYHIDVFEVAKVILWLLADFLRDAHFR